MLVAYYFIDVEVPCTVKKKLNVEIAEIPQLKNKQKVFSRYSFYTWVQIMGIFGKGAKYGVVS